MSIFPSLYEQSDAATTVKNVFFTAYLPLSAYVSFDNTGLPYNISATVRDGQFDPDLYAAYSPIFMTAALCMAYFVSFASFGAVFTHTFYKSMHYHL